MAKFELFSTKTDNDDDANEPTEMDPKVYDELAAELINPYVRLERMPHSLERSLRIKNELQKKEGVKVMYSVEFMTLNEKIFQSYVLLERLSPDDIQNLLKKKD